MLCQQMHPFDMTVHKWVKMFVDFPFHIYQSLRFTYPFRVFSISICYPFFSDFSCFWFPKCYTWVSRLTMKKVPFLQSCMVYKSQWEWPPRHLPYGRELPFHLVTAHSRPPDPHGIPTPELSPHSQQAGIATNILLCLKQLRTGIVFQTLL